MSESSSDKDLAWKPFYYSSIIILNSLFNQKKKSNPRKRNEGAFHAWYGMYGLESSSCMYVWVSARVRNCSQIRRLMIETCGRAWDSDCLSLGKPLVRVLRQHGALCWSESKLSPPFFLFYEQKNKNEIEKKGHPRYTSIIIDLIK